MSEPMGTLDIPGPFGGARFDLGDPRLAAAAWSRLVEPGDLASGALVRAVGPGPALTWVFAAVGDRGQERRAVADLSERIGFDERQARGLAAALPRWAPRLEQLDPGRDVGLLVRMGGEVLIPGDASWPSGLESLGEGRPHALWVRGEGAAEMSIELQRSVALVGARACTDYGTEVAIDIATGLVDRGFAIVSGGAYGIDAAAHRGALAVGGRTIVVLAGGIDRLYPAGNARLLQTVAAQRGVIASEVPPGAVPSRSRFLQRNRLIAALSRATVVVEAAWRSGSLSTATHAQNLLRPVGAVPGPVTSMASAGTHRLMREQGAICVTDAEEVAELAGELGPDLSEEPHVAASSFDQLGPSARAVYDALPLRTASSPEAVTRAAGVSGRQALATLGELELSGIAERVGERWRRVPGR